jgi:alkylation response protein AidB-like acyl-CoA dehydrogenase
MTDFYQTPPRLANSFDDDRVLRSYLRRTLPAEMLVAIEPALHALGARATGEMLALADAAEANPPRHVPYDAWGRRVDRIETSDAWRALDRIAAEEGIVATAYERAHGAWSRVHQFARLHLYHPSSAIYSCPLAMTDGAARVLTLLGGGDPVLAAAVERLTTRDPARFWTSGQWMTERSGGSDVSGTSTVARERQGFEYLLSGTKWFTSATTSQMALTLARIDDAVGDTGSQRGSGLSVFYIELRDGAGALHGIRVNRLKDKLGTRALPTAELTLDQTPARLVGGPGHGVRKIAALLNVTRYYNAACSASGMRRAIALASDYAKRRVAFGRSLSEHPLHAETLATMQVQYAAAFHLAARLAELLGREEAGEATEDERLLLRLLTPAVKAFTGKQAVAVASEALEAFGGAGYIEDTGLPRLLRDAQVLSIWEGTTNVLALDVLRALGKGAPLDVLRADVERRLAGVERGPLVDAAAGVRDGLRRVLVHAAAPMPDETRQASARAFTFAIARTYAGALLIEQAAWGLEAEDDVTAVETALRWCAGCLAPLPAADPARPGIPDNAE